MLSCFRKPKKKKWINNILWTSLCRTFARLLTDTTQIDFIDVPLLSFLNLPGTKSILLPSVRPGWQAMESWLIKVQAILFSGANVHSIINAKLECHQEFTHRQVNLPLERAEWPSHETPTSSRKNVHYHHQRLCIHHDQHRWDKRKVLWRLWICYLRCSDCR